MKKIVLSVLLSVFVVSLFAQVTSEDNQKEIKRLQRKIRTLKSENVNLRAKTRSSEKNITFQGTKIDSLSSVLQATNNKIVDNRTSLTKANTQINQISQESGEITTRMTKTTQYFAISLLVLLILIVLELIILNVKRKKEITRLFDKVVTIESELTNKILEMQKIQEQKLIDVKAKSSQEIAKTKEINTKKNEEMKILINRKNDEMKSLIETFNKKIESDMAEKISAIENKVDKKLAGLAMDIADTKKLFDEENVKIREEINQVAKKNDTK